MIKYLCACTVLVAALAVAGCGSSKGQAGSVASSKGSSKSYPELRWGLTVWPGVLDTTKEPEGTPYVIEGLAVQRLVEFESDGKVRPELASSVEQPNPTTYVYHLRSVKFSDGKPMTAADVVFSLDRNIDGKEAWDTSYWEDVASITARDSSTVVVKLKRPSAIFQGIVAFSGQVIEKAAAEESGEKTLGTPGHMLIGTGPWKIDSYTPEVSVQLSRNPYWTGQRQPAEKITVDLFKTEATMALALRSGGIDGTFGYASPKIFANVTGVRQLRALAPTMIHGTANTKLPPFNDVHVRRALAYATDSKGMVDAIFPSGDAIESPTLIPATLFAGLGSPSKVNQLLAAVPKYEFDLAKAKEELAKSAYPHGFTTSIEVEQDHEDVVAAAQIFASDLAKIGIKAHVEELTPAQAGARWLVGKARLAIIENGAVYSDPDGLMSDTIAPGELNSAKYSNPVVDKLLSESVETLNRPKRLQMIGKLLGVEGSEAPYWPMFSPLTLGSLSDKYVLPGFSYWTSTFGSWALNVKLAS